MEPQKFNKKDLLEQIKPDKKGNFSLTKLWKLTSGDPTKAPAKWQESEPVQRFITTAAKILNIGISDIINSKRGKGGGTSAHKQVFLEYAQYLDSELAVIVNEVFFERIEEEKNPDLSVKRGIKNYHKKGLTPQEITQRLNSIGIRNQFTSMLKEHGVVGDGYKDCTNAIYIGLFGNTAKKIRQQRNLPDGCNIRENVSTVELAAIMFAEALATDDIETNRKYGNEECKLTSNRAARTVSNSVIQFRNKNI